MWSVPRRSNCWSTTSRMWSGRLFGPSRCPSGPYSQPNLVAMTTPSRRPFSARPSSFSLVHGPYASAVSRKSQPSSSARWMVAIDSSSSGTPYAQLIPMQPRPIAEVVSPCRPRFLFSMPPRLPLEARSKSSPQEGRAPAAEKVVQHVLDRLADLGGQVEDGHGILGLGGVVLVRADRVAEGDHPLRRQRHQAQQAEHRPRRGDRKVREAEQPGQGLEVGDLRIDLLSPDDRARDDRHLGAQRGGHKAAPAEALEFVAVAERLADALEALGEDPDQL